MVRAAAAATHLRICLSRSAACRLLLARAHQAQAKQKNKKKKEKRKHKTNNTLHEKSTIQAKRIRSSVLVVLNEIYDKRRQKRFVVPPLRIELRTLAL